MQTHRASRLGALALAIHAASAQYQFNPGTYDEGGLYTILAGNYFSYASIWSAQLEDAKASHPGAYSVLTSIYNTDDIPVTPDAAFISHLASEMIEIGHTTVIDPNVNTSTLTFTGRTTTHSTPTASALDSASSLTDEHSSPAKDTSPTANASPTDGTSSMDVFTLSDSGPDSDSSAAVPNTKPAALL
ncbi:hypothetical protein LPJ61_005896, partial [Coemansia biformis]